MLCCVASEREREIVHAAVGGVASESVNVLFHARCNGDCICAGPLFGTQLQFPSFRYGVGHSFRRIQVRIAVITAGFVAYSVAR